MAWHSRPLQPDDIEVQRGLPAPRFRPGDRVRSVVGAGEPVVRTEVVGPVAWFAWHWKRGYWLYRLAVPGRRRDRWYTESCLVAAAQSDVRPSGGIRLGAPDGCKVRPGDVVVLGFYWASGRLGKTMCSFAVELLRPGRQRDVKTFVCRVVEFRTCWYWDEDENGARYQSPLMTTLAELPDAVAEDVRAFLGSEIAVGAVQVRHGTVQFIPCPGSPHFVAWTEAIRGTNPRAAPGASPDPAA